MESILCFDVGGTSIKYGLSDEQNKGRLLARGSLPNVIRTEGAAAFVRSIIAVTDRITAAEKVSGIAISLAGVVDCGTGQLIRPSQYFPGLDRINLSVILGEKTGLPVSVENDVNCAALAEYHYGAGKGARKLLMMTIGTGIGGAILFDGRLYRGSTFAAGEIGQARLGSARTWEDWASVTALLQEAAAVRPDHADKLDGRAFFALVAAGDGALRQVLAELVHRWAVGIVSLCWILNPDRVIIGGGISAQHAVLQPLLDAALRQEMEPLLRERTDVCFARLGNDAGMLGAACYFRQRHRQHKKDSGAVQVSMEFT